MDRNSSVSGLKQSRWRMTESLSREKDVNLKMMIPSIKVIKSSSNDTDGVGQRDGSQVKGLVLDPFSLARKGTDVMKSLRYNNVSIQVLETVTYDPESMN